MGCTKSVEIKPPLSPPAPSPPPPPPPRRQNTGDYTAGAVDIKYDDRTDERTVRIQEKNDPAPCPTHPNNNTISKVSNHFFDDKDFQLSSEDADIRESDTAEDEVALTDDDARSVVTSLLKKQAGKQIPKVSFAAVDEHALKASDAHADSFESLRDYLTGSLRGEHKELLTARAIVMWLGKQDSNKKDHGEPTISTPKGLLQCLKMGKMTYATCYVILCRSAGLSCTLINGIVKAAGYEPGDLQSPSSPWTAVFAGGAWRIIHPFWVCRALFGQSLAGWVKVEREIQSTPQRTGASTGVARNAFQEYYFMPNPEHFVHECFPDDARWQLLPKSLMVKTEQDFFDMPYLLPPFFGLGLELISKQKCHLVTINGTCKIQIKAKWSNSHLIVLGYELFVKQSDDFDTAQIPRMVFNSRANEYFMFDIRFPVKGIFKLVIYGGPFKSPLLRLCEFKITCNEPMSDIDLFPLSCGNLGWGPGPASTKAGLLLPSRPNGLIAVPKDTRQTEITFSIQKKNISASSYAAILLDGSDEVDEKTFENCVRTNANSHSKRLTIAVKLPRDGEFGLRITSTSPGGRSAVCNYLLSTVVHKHETANVRIAKKNLKDSVLKLEQEKTHGRWKDIIDECNKLLEKCRNQKVDLSDDDMCIAETTIELYTYKNALRDCIVRRNLRVIHIVLVLTNKYKNKMAIEEDVLQVERFKKDLIALRKCSSEATKLQDAFIHVSMDNTPPNEVVAVYKAVLFLLRFSQQETKTWDMVQNKIESGQLMVKKLRLIHASDIPKLDRDRVERELGNVDVAVLQREHEQVFALYDWIKSVLNIYNTRRYNL